MSKTVLTFCDRDGNSLSVTLPEGWLERVGVEKGDELFIEADDGSIRFIAD